MAHGTRVNGASYGITGGKCRVNGTVYDIKKGRTLIGGTGYDITFGLPTIVHITKKITEYFEKWNTTEYRYVTINGGERLGDADTVINISGGEVILYAWSGTGFAMGNITVNGTVYKDDDFSGFVDLSIDITGKEVFIELTTPGSRTGDIFINY